MKPSSAIHDPPIGMGLTAVVLGSVGLLLFFMPVLGIPLGAIGLLFGVVGLLIALGGWASLRWALAGVVLCCLALVINCAIAVSSARDVPGWPVSEVAEPSAERPYIPPPARPNWLGHYR